MLRSPAMIFSRSALPGRVFNIRDTYSITSDCVQVSCDACRSLLFDEGRRTALACPSNIRLENGTIPQDFQPTLRPAVGDRLAPYLTLYLPVHYMIMNVPDGTQVILASLLE